MDQLQSYQRVIGVMWISIYVKMVCLSPLTSLLLILCPIVTPPRLAPKLSKSLYCLMNGTCLQLGLWMMHNGCFSEALCLLILVRTTGLILDMVSQFESHAILHY